MVAAALFSITFLLTLGGMGLFAADYVGWAQFLWVIASGTAGGWIAVLVEHRVHRDLQRSPEYWRNQPP